MGCTSSTKMMYEVEKLHQEVQVAIAEREKLQESFEIRLAQSEYKQKLLKEMVRRGAVSLVLLCTGLTIPEIK
jgi:hypothetical protein